MRWARLLVVTLALAASYPALAADAPPPVRYLMAKPLSLFEWGIYRLERRAEHFAWDDLDIRKQICDVRYNDLAGQLVVACTVFPRHASLSATPARTVCGSVLRQIRSHFGVDGSEHAELTRKIQGIGTFFRPEFYTPEDMPKSLARDLEAISRVEVSVLTGTSDDPPFRNRLTCEGMLLSQDVKYIGQ